jgi:hypothetical protein
MGQPLNVRRRGSAQVTLGSDLETLLFSHVALTPVMSARCEKGGDSRPDPKGRLDEVDDLPTG